MKTTSDRKPSRRNAQKKLNYFVAAACLGVAGVLVTQGVKNWSPDPQAVDEAVKLAAHYLTTVEQEIDAALACETAECRLQLLDTVSTPETVSLLVMRISYVDKPPSAPPAMLQAINRAEVFEKAFLTDLQKMHDAICGYVVTALRCFRDNSLDPRYHRSVLPGAREFLAQTYKQPADTGSRDSPGNG